MEKAKEMRSQFESSRGAKSSFFSHLQTGLFSSCPAVIKTYILCLLELSGWVKFVHKSPGFCENRGAKWANPSVGSRRLPNQFHSGSATVFCKKLKSSNSYEIGAKRR